MRLMRDTATADAAAFLRALIRDGTAVQVSDIAREARLAGLLRADQPISQCKPLRDARIALGFQRQARGVRAGGTVGVGDGGVLAVRLIILTDAVSLARSRDQDSASRLTLAGAAWRRNGEIAARLDRRVTQNQPAAHQCIIGRQH
ncbi:MAG: hypothetical protein WCD82_02395 [Xanthobacteraceae bacterium]|jgi:hypothetical protein